MDSNPYTRLFKLPNEQIDAKPPHGSTTVSLRSFTILQSPYFNEHKKGPISSFSDRNYYLYVIVDALKHSKKLFCLNLTKQQEREYKTQQKTFYVPFDTSWFTDKDKSFLIMFNFEHTKFKQTQFE